MDHRQPPVPGEMDVQLHPIATLQRTPEGGQGILRRPGLPVVEAPVGIPKPAEHRPLWVVPPPSCGHHPQAPAQKQQYQYQLQPEHRVHFPILSDLAPYLTTRSPSCKEGARSRCGHKTRRPGPGRRTLFYSSPPISRYMTAF